MPSLPISINAHHFGEARHALVCYAGEAVLREEVMSEWLSDTAVITTILSVSGALVGIGMWIGRVNSDREGFKAHMERMDGHMERIDGHMQRMDGHMERIDGHMQRMDGRMERIDGHMQRIDGHMKRMDGYFTTIAGNTGQIFMRLSVMERRSPLRLNELGRSIADSLDFRNWVADIAGSLHDSMRDKSEYDIQEFCFEYFRHELQPSEEQEGKLKDCAYQAGVPVSVVLDVLALEMRDILIAAKQSDPNASSASQPTPNRLGIATC